MLATSVRRTSAGLSRPGRPCRRSAWPTVSWIASGPAATSVSTAAAMSSMPLRNGGSPKKPWSTATSMQRPEAGWKRRLRREGADTGPPGGALDNGCRRRGRGREGAGAPPWPGSAAGVAGDLDGHGVLACGGSAPPGAPAGAYAELAALARSRGAFAIVDANGPLLAAALEAGADLVTPNLGEAEALLH